MQVQRNRQPRRRHVGRGRIRRDRRNVPQQQMRRLRVMLTVVALVTACVIAGTGIFFWVRFSAPFAEAAKRNEENLPDQIYENNGDLPRYEDSFLLTVASTASPLPDTYEPELTDFEGVEVDQRIVPYLKAMLSAARSDGVSLQIETGYVSREAQQKKYDQQLESFLEQGMSRMKALENVDRSIGAGGCNDLQTGMAVRFTTEEKGSFRETRAFRWLRSHCLQYGFIQRYPQNKTDHTMHNADAAHYRFVGPEHAPRIRGLGFSLEEYADYMALQPH